jgi:hypothetical protein
MAASWRGSAQDARRCTFPPTIDAARHQMTREQDGEKAGQIERVAGAIDLYRTGSGDGLCRMPRMGQIHASPLGYAR